MADERLRLVVQERVHTGSRETRRLRREGLIPGVLYGGDGNGARAISVPERDLRRVLTGSHGLHAILDVVLEGEQARASILKDFQRDPVRARMHPSFAPLYEKLWNDLSLAVDDAKAEAAE